MRQNHPHDNVAQATRIVRIHPLAPPKPALGERCNGCGLCCAWAPCPLGIVLSRRLRGPCSALSWDDAGRHYRCGAMAEPCRWLPWLPAAWASRLAARWISAGRGCDAALAVETRPAPDRERSGEDTERGADRSH